MSIEEKEYAELRVCLPDICLGEMECLTNYTATTKTEVKRRIVCIVFRADNQRLKQGVWIDRSRNLSKEEARALAIRELRLIEEQTTAGITALACRLTAAKAAREELQAKGGADNE